MAGLLGTNHPGCSYTNYAQRLTLSGYRLGKLDNLSLKSFSLTQAYVYLLYFLSIGFVISAAAINSGQGLVTNSACKASIRLCLGLYASSKVTM
jgi:hypothetical protein